MCIQNVSRFLTVVAVGTFILASLSACGMHTEAVYPTKVTGTDKILYTDQDRILVYGKPAAQPIDGPVHKTDHAELDKRLWKAALDIVTPLPLAAVDAPKGVIQTDWHENPATPGERVKYLVTISDRASVEDSLHVTASRQVKRASEWRDAPAPDALAESLKHDILARAGIVSGQ